MVAPPYAGHLNPLLTIAGHLGGKGVQTTFVTGPAMVPTCRALGFDAVPVLPDDAQAMERIANTARITGHPLRALGQVRANLRLLSRALPDVQAAADRVRPDVIVADFCAPAAGAVAGRLGVPWITTIPTPFAIGGRRGTPAYCGGWSPPAGAPGRLRDAAGRTLTRTMKSLAGVVFRDELASFGGSLHRPDGSESFYSDQAILALGLAEFEFDRDWPDVLRFIGPITADPTSIDAPSLIEPVETPGQDHAEIPGRARDDGPRSRAAHGFDPLDPRPRVLVTLGTHLPWAKRELVGQVVELADRLPGHHFVVALGEASRHTGRTRVAGTVDVVPWLPYDQTMAAFDAVIHHGGAGVTYSTLRAEVACLVWPQDYDQVDFAARIVHHGLGLRIRRLGDAVTALPRALALPRAPLRRFAELVRGANPLDQVERVLHGLVGRP